MKTSLSLVFFTVVLVSGPARAQEGPVTIPLPPPAPAKESSNLKLSLAAPSPAFGQPRGLGRPRATTAQFPLRLAGVLVPDSPLGKITLDSDNLVSSDAFDTAARLGVRVGLEKKIGPLTFVGGLGLIGNQKATTKNLSMELGTRLPLGLKVSGASPTLDLDILRFENRGVSAAVSPRHTGKNVLAPALGLKLPPLFVGRGTDTEKTPHVLLGASAWYFSNEKAAPGFKPGKLESLLSFGFVVPKAALPLKVPGVQGFSLDYQAGGNPAANYAQVHNLRFGFLFTPPILPGLPALPRLPVLPSVLKVAQRPEK